MLYYIIPVAAAEADDRVFVYIEMEPERAPQSFPRDPNDSPELPK